MLAYEAKFWCLVHQVIFRNAEQAQQLLSGQHKHALGGLGVLVAVLSCATLRILYLSFRKGLTHILQGVEH